MNTEGWTWSKVGVWSEVQDIHTGDFIQTGTSQLLVLLSKSHVVGNDLVTCSK